MGVSNAIRLLVILPPFRQHLPLAARFSTVILSFCNSIAAHPLFIERQNPAINGLVELQFAGLFENEDTHHPYDTPCH